MKFAHIADTHIKNLKYHYEYRTVFEKLYQKLRKEKVDYIIHCGDIAHTKTQLSPEFVELCTDFLRNLADIAPTYVILGNHDGNLKNSNRQDALTPIVDALGHPSLHLLKNSGEVCLNDKFTINVLSVFDRDNWADISDTSRINIALYHGAISNSETDLGWVMEHGEDNVSIFKGHDFAFLGDIHKTNQVLDYEGRIRYAGSTVQQNHGETNDKGFLVWNIKSRDKWDVKHIVLENPKPFITIELTPKGRMPKKTVVPNGARLRLVSNNNLPLDSMKKAVELAKYKFKPESITFLNRASNQKGSVDDLTDGLINDNLRDVAVQEEFIEEYLKDYQADDKLLERVLSLNSRYNKIVEEKEEVGRNVNWRLNEIEWDNLFNFGEGNKIDFDKFSGIVGIFGKNYSGKSSIIDSVLYTLFNTTSKNERKNLNIINQNKEYGKGKIKLSVGNKKYTIERNSTKYVKKLKGEETLEAKTDLNFEVYDQATDVTESLNGLTRGETDKIIRKQFGTLEDFLMTSMSSQLGSLQFISEGSTKRKEILAKFLDLEMFEKKYKLAKDDASDLRGALKRLEGMEFDDDIYAVEKELLLNESETLKHSNRCEKIKKRIASLRKNKEKTQKAVNSVVIDVIDIEDVLIQIKEKKKQSADLISESIQVAEDISSNREHVKKINSFVKMFDIEALHEKKELAAKKLQLLNEFVSEINSTEESYERQQNKKLLLKEVPCGDKYPQCKFICDAHKASSEMIDLKKKIDFLNNNHKEVESEIVSLDPEKIEDHIKKYDQVINKRTQLESEIEKKEVLREKTELQNKSVEKEIDTLLSLSKQYEENRELIENKESFIKELEKIKDDLSLKERDLKDCQDSLMEYYKEHGSLEQKLNSLKEQKEELENLRKDFSAYDLFMTCMHSNGISYDIIKKKLPVINNEIAKVLANVVNFEVFFENDSRHLKILIKHPSHEPRPIEMGSGAEKTIAAMAIRLALLSVSNLPKSDLFILDEPGTALDADNMDGFVRILELVKSYFKTVLLISHLDSLKDCVDMQITIDKAGHYAKVVEA